MSVHNIWTRLTKPVVWQTFQRRGRNYTVQAQIDMERLAAEVAQAIDRNPDAQIERITVGHTVLTLTRQP